MFRDGSQTRDAKLRMTVEVVHFNSVIYKSTIYKYNIICVRVYFKDR